MKRIIFLTITALLALNAFGQMAGGASKKYRSSNNSTQVYNRGYKGFVEVGGSVGAHIEEHWDGYDITHTETLGTFGAYTSHGYQFSSYFFAGAGIGLEYSNDVILPLFAELRCNILNPNQHKYTPFVGARAGCNLIGDSGFWGNIFAGYRFPLQKSLAFNLSVGYQFHTYSWKINGGGDTSNYYDGLDQTCSIRVGLEF